MLTKNNEAHGNQGSNFIVGSAGKDYLVGNGGADVIYAGAGDDYIVLNQDNIAQLIKVFDQAATGSQGRLARVDGGSGVDTLTLYGDVSVLDRTAISNPGLGFIHTGVGLSRLSNIERIDLHGGNKAKLTLELKDVMDMNAGVNTFKKENFSTGIDASDTKRHPLVIDGSSDNSVEIKGRQDWNTTSVKTVRSYGHFYEVYNSVGDSKGQLLVESSININWA